MPKRATLSKVSEPKRAELPKVLEPTAFAYCDLVSHVKVKEPMVVLASFGQWALCMRTRNTKELAVFHVNHLQAGAPYTGRVTDTAEVFRNIRRLVEYLFTNAGSEHHDCTYDDLRKGADAYLKPLWHPDPDFSVRPVIDTMMELIEDDVKKGTPIESACDAHYDVWSDKMANMIFSSPEDDETTICDGEAWYAE